MSSLLLGSLDLTAGPYEAQVGSSMGSWASITTAVTSLFLDGSVVSGEATANRQITLQVFVNATTQPALTAACEALIGQANQLSNTLTWTPDGGVPIVYEVFRTAGPVQTDAAGEFQLYHIYQLTFPALPFARSATREMAGATTPAIVIDDFNTTFTGARLQVYPTAGNAFWWVCPVGSAGTTPLVALVATTDMNTSLTVVTNCTLTYPSADYGHGTKTAAAVTATAAGLVEVRSTTAWNTSGDVVTVAVNLGSTFPTAQLAQAGVEWLDAGSVSIRTDWGTPMAAGAAGNPTVWAAAKIPATAAKVRVRLRIPAATLSQVINVVELIAVTSTFTSITAGSGTVNVTPPGSPNTSPAYASAGYLYRLLPATKNLSTGVVLLLRLTSQAVPSVAFPLVYGPDLTTSGSGTVSVRLFDSTGRWSRFWFTGTILPPNSSFQLQSTLASPYQNAAAGAASLTDIVAYDVDLRVVTDFPCVLLDDLGAGPAPAANLSPRGTVLTVSPVVGSARTTAGIVVSGSVDLTDWLVAAIDGTKGLPLLTTSSDVATADAPAGYDGVYSVLGCIAPSNLPANPTCTVVQKNAGVTVATRVLTGTPRTPSNCRYVDFGALGLPLVAAPPENLGISYTFTLTPSSLGWVEVLVIDVDASLAWVDNLVTALPLGWVDEPDIVAGLGKVWVGTNPNRSDARALALPPTMSRPLQVKAPSTRLLVYSTTIAPNVMLSYWPRWLVEPS